MASAPPEGHDGDQAAGVTVDALLGEALFAGSLVAGAAGRQRTVSWCVPWADDDPSLAGSAVVVTHTDLVDQPRLVEHAAARGAAAVIVRNTGAGAGSDRPGAGVDEALRAADAHNLPLLFVPPGTGFRDVSRLIGTKVLSQSTHVLEYGTRVHRQLGDVFARGGGLPGLAGTMAELSGASVTVLGGSGEVLAAAGDRTPEEVQPAIAVHLDDGSGPDRADGTAGSPPGHGQGHGHVEPHLLTLDLGGESAVALLAEVRIVDHLLGWLLLVEPTDHTDHDLSQHRAMLHEGVSLTASELLRQQSVREAQERARNDFVHALLHGRFTDSLELAARAEHYRFPVESRFAVLIASETGLNADRDLDRRRLREASRAIRALATDLGLSSMTAVIGSMIVVVHELSGTDGDTLAEAREIQELGERIHRRVSALLGVDVRVSCGRAVSRATGIASSYRDARTTAALARHVGTSRVSAYADLRVFAALAASAASPAAHTFAEEILEPLRRAESQQGSLEDLVLTYIQESGNINATARRLHLHRNTMLYKLDRVSRALQLDIRSAETQFMVWLAHHLEALREVTSSLDQELAGPT